MPTSLLWTDAFPETEIVAVVTDAVGADVSICSERAVERLDSTPLSLCFALTDQVPSLRAGLNWHVPVAAVATKVHVEVELPDVAITVTVNPGVREVSETLGVVFEVGDVTVGVPVVEGS